VIGIVIPAHNEEACIAACLVAARKAASHPCLLGRRVHLLVVLDSCSDATAEIVAAMGVKALAIEARSVGMARAAGAAEMLEHGCTWLAFTDADSHVAPDWLVRQLALNVDAVCGTVSVHDWHQQLPGLHQHYQNETEYCDADGHRHIHGANLGVCALAYKKVGGFMPLDEHEDVELIQSLLSFGAEVAFSAAPRVSTSARLLNRVGGGFGGLMQHLHDRAINGSLTDTALVPYNDAAARAA
jgi:glycosyltransferase involved in cell wall biosynthesis